MTKIFCDACGGDVGNPYYTKPKGGDYCRRCYELWKAELARSADAVAAPVADPASPQFAPKSSS
jgi:hypothetical protein